MDASLRTFFAIKLSESLAQYCEDLQAQLRAEFTFLHPTWVLPQNLHITLNFMGETSASDIDEMVTKARTISQSISPFSLKCVALSLFESHAKHIVVLNVDRHAQLLALHQQLASAMTSLGFKPDKREYTPHVTLLRLRDETNLKMIRLLETQVMPDSFPVHEIVLLESQQKSEGVYYRALETFALTGKSDGEEE